MDDILVFQARIFAFLAFEDEVVEVQYCDFLFVAELGYISQRALQSRTSGLVERIQAGNGGIHHIGTWFVDFSDDVYLNHA